MLRVELLRDCFLLEEASRLKMNLGGWILPIAGVIAVAFLADSDVGYGTGGSGSGISSPGTCGSESIPNGQRASLPHRRPVGRPCIRSSLSSGQTLQERQQLQKNPRLGHRQGPTPRQQSQPRTAEQRGRPLAHQRVLVCWVSIRLRLSRSMPAISRTSASVARGGKPFSSRSWAAQASGQVLRRMSVALNVTSGALPVSIGSAI